MRRATLLDVAKMVGVDVSTVSRVLRGEAQQRVRPEVREKILSAAKQLQYLPDLRARGLRTARTFGLGIVIPQIDNPVFSEAIRGAESAAREAGFSLLISYRDHNLSQSGILQQLAHAHRVDGLLVASLDTDESVIEGLGPCGIPCVILNRLIPGIDHCVVLDTRSAARMAVDHLISLGHHRIAHLAGRTGGFNAGERLRGYRESLAAHGIPFDPSLVVHAGYSAEGGARAVTELFERVTPPPTAIFAATLVSAAGALGQLHRMGVRIPEQVSVAAVHDALFADVLYPPLTTVRTPTYEMGRVGVKLLISLINGDKPQAVPPLPPEGLIVRASTGAACDPLKFSGRSRANSRSKL